MVQEVNIVTTATMGCVGVFSGTGQFVVKWKVVDFVVFTVSHTVTVHTLFVTATVSVDKVGDVMVAMVTAALEAGIVVPFTTPKRMDP